MFKLGLDFDGVLTRHPDYLRWLSDRLLHSGHEVHIITGRRKRDRKETLNTLKSIHFRYTKLHLYPGEYELGDGYTKLTDDEARAIGDWKVQLCEDLGIGLFLDDSLHFYETDFNCPVVHI